MVKLQYILLIHEVQKRFVVLLISKVYFSDHELRCYGYESNIILWVSVCVRKLQDFALAAF